LQDVRCFYSNTKKKEERWESKQDEKAACLSTDVDEEERVAQISSAHSQEGDARQSKREEPLRMQEESASPLLRRRKATVVKEDKEEVNADSLDLEKEEEEDWRSTSNKK